MISSKRIDIIAGFLLSAAFLFMVICMWNFNESDNLQQSQNIVYADEFTVTYTAKDYDVNYQDNAYSKIVFTGDSAVTDSAKVLIDGGTITILGGGVYELSGSLQDGRIVVNTSDDIPVQLVLNNVDLHSNDCSAIYVEHAESFFLTLHEDTQNKLSDGTNYNIAFQENGKPDAAIYCRSDLTINGAGALSVVGNYQDGIKCNDTLKVMSGSITIHANDDGIRANDCMALLDAELHIFAGADAIHSDGHLVLREAVCTISCSDDAIHAEQTMVMEPKSVLVDRCREGLEGKYIILNCGDISITASDDGINAVGNGSEGMGRMMQEITEENTYLVINGGKIWIDSSGDGIDSNGAAVMNGGIVTVYGSENNGNSSLDFVNGFLINGGTLLAVGSSGMAELPINESAQNVLVYYLPETYSNGSSITLLDAAGTVVMENSSRKQFNWVCISTETIKNEEMYTLRINETDTAVLESSAAVSCYGRANRFSNMENLPMAEGNGGRMRQ